MSRRTTPRLSLQGLKVLKAFRDASPSALAGADIMRAAGIASGTVYPILMRFEKAKIIVGRWETSRPEDMHRPRRCIYRLTPNGVAFAAESLKAVTDKP